MAIEWPRVSLMRAALAVSAELSKGPKDSTHLLAVIRAIGVAAVDPRILPESVAWLTGELHAPIRRWNRGSNGHRYIQASRWMVPGFALGAHGWMLLPPQGVEVTAQREPLRGRCEVVAEFEGAWFSGAGPSMNLAVRNLLEQLAARPE